MFKKIAWILLCLILSCLNFAWVPPSPFIDLPGFTGSPQITPEQAKQIVRQWEGDPNLSLPDPELDWTEGDPLSSPYYEFTAPRHYIVDAMRGYLCGVRYGLFPSNPQWLLSPQQAESIARQFCSQKYPNFNQINWVTNVEKDPIGAYTVTFRGRMPNGAWMLNACVVDINPDTGDILTYTASLPSSPPPTWEPLISQEQALQIAINATDFLEILNVEVIEFGGGEGVLVWGIGGIEGIFPDGSKGLAWVMVDALNGNLRYREYAASKEWMPLRSHIMVNGRLIKRTEGPLFVGEKAFVSEKLFKTLGGALFRVRFKPDEVITRGGKRYISVELLKRALPGVIWDVIAHKERHALYIILYGDEKGISCLPLKERIRIRSIWYEPEWVGKKKRLTDAERDKAIMQWTEKERRLWEQNREIESRLKRAKLFASEREIRKEFPKPYVDWEKITKHLKNQVSEPLSPQISSIWESLRGRSPFTRLNLVPPKALK
ncbi:hypothetical protein H5T87_11185 [bacterium]|nr:hypothetical protein [bacterium]